MTQHSNRIVSSLNKLTIKCTNSENIFTQRSEQWGLKGTKSFAFSRLFICSWSLVTLLRFYNNSIFFISDFLVNGYYLPTGNAYNNQILIKFDLKKLLNNVYVPHLTIYNCYLNDETVIYPSNIEINAPNGLQTTALMIFLIDRPIYLGEIKKRFNIFISSLLI